jgi:hypothetical protein
MEKIIYTKPVTNESEKSLFMKIPKTIYKGDKNWVQPLNFDVKKNLDTTKNPFYSHAKIKLWIAYKDGLPSGRIAAIVNDNHNKVHNDRTGFFGYFECINDYEVAKVLFDEAGNWLKENEMDNMRGPINLSTNDEVGLLVDGFDMPPVILMLYNPKYYEQLLLSCGFAKIRDLFAYIVRTNIMQDEKVMNKLQRISEMVLKREMIEIKTLNMNDFSNELSKVKEVYNNAWQHNWGFVPLTDSEMDFIADSLKPIVDKDLVYFAMSEGKPIGFSLAIPDMNQVFIKMKGKLFPFGIIKLLLNKKKVNSIRLITLGVIPKFQKRGIEAVFIKNTIDVGSSKGYKAAEISWILEDNIPMVQTAVNLGAEKYKTYRLFDKSL